MMPFIQRRCFAQGQACADLATATATATAHWAAGYTLDGNPSPSPGELTTTSTPRTITTRQAHAELVAQ